eukprot:8707910-Pyramimonas_sp.AAC.1
MTYPLAPRGGRTTERTWHHLPTCSRLNPSRVRRPVEDGLRDDVGDGCLRLSKGKRAGSRRWPPCSLPGQSLELEY